MSRAHTLGGRGAPGAGLGRLYCAQSVSSPEHHPCAQLLSRGLPWTVRQTLSFATFHTCQPPVVVSTSGLCANAGLHCLVGAVYTYDVCCSKVKKPLCHVLPVTRKN